MTDVCTWSAARVLDALRRRQLGSQEYTEALLDRIGRHDAALSLVVTLDADRALAAARTADDDRIAGRVRGPLHGLPMTLKDSLATAGLRTTSGADEYADHVPNVDADVVARLRVAGAIVLGKTNLPAHAADVQSYNALFGVSRNPWSPAHTVGGSSGGSAGALAAGLTPLEVGSDIAGSIRIPASCCGVVGHRPSPGLISARGQIPGPPGTLTEADLAVVGPMARSVADAALLLDVLAGPSRWDAPAWELELPPPRAARLGRPYRVGAWFDDPWCPVDPEVHGLLVAAADRLAGHGVTVEHDVRPARSLEYSDGVFRRLLAAALAGQFTPAEIEERAAAAAHDPAAALDERLGSDHAHLRHRAWLSDNERRLQLRRMWHELFETWDAILLPVMPNAPIVHDTSEPPGRRRISVAGIERPYWDQITWAGLTGVASLPTTVVPAGLTSDGLPVGIAVNGPYLEDRTTLHLAALLTDDEPVQMPAL